MTRQVGLQKAVELIDGVIAAAEEIAGIYYASSRKGQEDRYGDHQVFEVEGLEVDLQCSISCSRHYTYKTLRYYIAGEKVNLTRVRSLRELLADLADNGDRAEELTVPQLRQRTAFFPHIYVPAMLRAVQTAKSKARRTALLKLTSEYAFEVESEAGETITVLL